MNGFFPAHRYIQNFFYFSLHRISTYSFESFICVHQTVQNLYKQIFLWFGHNRIKTIRRFKQQLTFIRYLFSMITILLFPEHVLFAIFKYFLPLCSATILAKALQRYFHLNSQFLTVFVHLFYSPCLKQDMRGVLPNIFMLHWNTLWTC